MFARADEVLPARPHERFPHDGVIALFAVLHQRALHLFFQRAFGDVHGLHGIRIQPRIVHTGGFCGGRGVEILHLLGHIPDGFEVHRQRDGVPEGTARVRRDEVGNEILLFFQLFVERIELFLEFEIHGKGRLVHLLQDGVGDVFGRDFQLSADVVFDQLAQEFVRLVVQHVIVADARADEHLFHPFQLAQGAQQIDVLLVGDLEIGAFFPADAVFLRADPLFKLLFAGGVAEVGGGAAHVVNVALEILVRDQLFCLGDQALLAALLHDPALVVGDGAVIAVAETAAHGR